MVLSVFCTVYVWLVFLLGTPLALLAMHFETCVTQKLKAIYYYILEPLLNNPFWEFIVKGSEEKVWPETKRGFLVMGNHRSFLDPFLLAAVVHIKTKRNVCFLAKDFLFDIPVFGSVIKMGENIPVHMNKKGSGTDKEKNNEIELEIVNRIERGFAICVFPEGGIQKGKELGSLKKGIFQIAVTNRIPVHVVAFSNNDRLVPDGWNGFMHHGSSVINIHHGKHVETESVESLMDNVGSQLRNSYKAKDICYFSP